ncbi:bifunctional 3'-5' exonuclease/ATP-dependent helicase WRN-like isoform X2 [Argopecten irradians]|uniref:bifunctional 3'-5' exonuclease/ATP-dependent helicase WRN-like isoform X2 n=1 Tax=Argopecten irradians TaxID=31199 RepID=UPI00371517CF
MPRRQKGLCGSFANWFWKVASISNDQVGKLSNVNGITAAYIGSSPEEDTKIRNGEIDLIYGSPEAFVGDSVWRANIQKLNVSAIVVDEFHTIATWGDDDDGTQKRAFRKWFASVGELRSLFPAATVLALSATCTVKIKKRVMKVLEMKDDTIEIIMSPNKPNIKISVFKVPSNTEMAMYWLAEGLSSKREHFPRTIVYCVSIKDVSKIYSYLTTEIPECASLVEMFHSETPEVKKDKIITELKVESGSPLRLVVSSSALGMGIDVKDCQSVVLFGPPTNLVDLIQQIGRIGRDNSPSVALILYHSYHLGQLGFEVKSLVKSTDCRRVQLLGNFLNPKELTDIKNKESGLHTCCDFCTLKCSCGECESLLLEKLFSCTQSELENDSDGNTEPYDLSDYEFEEELLMADTAND